MDPDNSAEWPLRCACGAVYTSFDAEPTTIDATAPAPLPTGVGGHFKAALAKFGVPPCQACAATAHKMDLLGPDGCREQFEDLLDDIEANAAKHRALRVRVFVGITSKARRRRKIGELLTAAIESAAASSD